MEFIYELPFVLLNNSTKINTSIDINSVFKFKICVYINNNINYKTINNYHIILSTIHRLRICLHSCSSASSPSLAPSWTQRLQQWYPAVQAPATSKPRLPAQSPCTRHQGETPLNRRLRRRLHRRFHPPADQI